MCATHGMDADAGAALLGSLEGAGVLIRLEGAGLEDTLFLRPDEGLLRVLSSSLHLPYTSAEQGRLDRLQQVLDSKLKQLEPRRVQKEQLDASATRSTHLTIGAMLVYLAGQNAVFFWMTFFVWSCESDGTPAATVFFGIF